MLWHPRTELAAPLGWARSHTVWLVRSVDLFADAFSADEVAAAFGVMAAATRQVFFLRTRRADVMTRWFAWLDDEARAAATTPADLDRARVARCREAARRALAPGVLPEDEGAPSWPLGNVALGIRATRQSELEQRLHGLLDAPAALRFIDADPMREALRFHGFARVTCPGCRVARWIDQGAPPAERPPCAVCRKTLAPEVRAVRWLRLSGDVGGERAAFDLAWARDAIAEGRAWGATVCVQRLGVNPVADGAPVAFADPLGERVSEWPSDLRERGRPWPPFARHPLEVAPSGRDDEAVAAGPDLAE